MNVGFASVPTVGAAEPAESTLAAEAMTAAARRRGRCDGERAAREARVLAAKTRMCERDRFSSRWESRAARAERIE